MSDHILARLHVDKSAGVPIYQQIQLQLEQMIANGTWRLKEPLPSETALPTEIALLWWKKVYDSLDTLRGAWSVSCAQHQVACFGQI